MARGRHPSPPASSSLPKVEFEIIHDEKLKIPGGIINKQANSFGCELRHSRPVVLASIPHTQTMPMIITIGQTFIFDTQVIVSLVIMPFFLTLSP